MYRSDAVYGAILSKHGELLEFVPDQYKTRTLYITAVKNTVNASSFIKKEDFTYDLAKTLVEVNGRLLSRLPDEFKTHELCLTAVSNCGTSLASVPEHLRNVEMCIIALMNDSEAEYYWPDVIPD